MSGEPSTEVGRRRTRGSTDSQRSESLKRLKAIKRGSWQAGGSQIKMEKPIYDIVDPVEYEAIVAKRREEVKGFIVDDNGLGYRDEGQEEDWSIAGVSVSSEESEGESEKIKRRKADKSEKKEKEIAKRPHALASAAALIGKQKITSMLTASVSKKGIQKNTWCASILDDALAEIGIDENDRERRRLIRGNSSRLSSNTFQKPDVVNLDDVNVSNGHSENDVKDEWLKKCSEPDERGRSDTTDIVIVPTEEMKDKVETSMEHENWDAKCLPNKVGIKDLKDELDVKEVEKKVFSLNAKVEEANVTGFSATVGWKAVQSAGQNAVVADSDVSGHWVEQISSSEEKLNFDVEPDGSLPFHILDAHEKMYDSNAGNLYLFGKVKSEQTYHSCCAVVKNMQRCVYAIPTVPLMFDETIMELEKKVEESQNAKDSQVALRSRLHELTANLKTEITKELLDRNVSSFSMTPVKRSYAFERSDIPHGENYVLKINYPFKDPPLPSDLNGKNFCALLGTHTSCLELFLVKRKIKGPSWLSISKFSNCTASQQVSWCKFEVIVDCPKDIQISRSSKITSEIPPVVVTAISVKTVINEKDNVNEIVSAHVICCHKAKIDAPTLSSEWTRPGMLSHFTIVRKLDVGSFPMGFKKEAAKKNAKAGSTVIFYRNSERALLYYLMLQLYKLDSDVLVGHNISGFDLDVLLHRVQAYKVPGLLWSKIGRLKQSAMPKLNKGSSVFGSGASPGIMSCIAGRLLCDTYTCSRDLLKEVSYSLTELAKTQLNKDRKEIKPHDIPLMFQSSESLIEFIEYGETDAWLAMELMFHLSVLPLTRQLTTLSGNLWHRTLQGARAQRVEYLLLHTFHAKKFIVPDKFSSQSKGAMTTKRKVANGVSSKEGDPDCTNIDDNENNQGKPKKGPAYSGGLVLEPKKGLYDKYVLLLDFNSLYPSIIQEYNICFTTIDRSADGPVPLLSTGRTGVLPELLKYLVARRRAVKAMLKKASGLRVQQLDIQQQALKLTANSMYGCLGFSNSRFYAKPLAELITLQGREILQRTVDLVQNTLNYEVIYGDTDSIMIYTGLDDTKKVKEIAGKVIQEVNKKYRTLEIDLDGMYKRMLLLKKKKYAAVKIHFKDDISYEVIERKGLDMIRRDWSLLSKELGDFCLGQILSGWSCEDVVEAIHNALKKVQEEMRNGEIPLEKYVITKTLTKTPEAYRDAKSQPHVEVALRLKRNGYVTGCSAGDTVPYIICCEQGNGSTTSVGIAQWARHPDELQKDNASWIVDIDYYLAQQIHPVISRLCASIQGTSPARLAECLGLDPSKFQNKSNDSANADPSSSLLFTLDDEERYRGCEPLTLSCPSCLVTFECSPIWSSVCKLLNPQQGELSAGSPNSLCWQKFRCPKCPKESDGGTITPALIANQVKKQVERFISTYYKCLMMCDDETCNYTTRSINLRLLGDAERGTTCPNYPYCNGHLYRKYTEADLYKQLTYFCYTLDTVRCTEKIKGNNKLLVESELAKIRPQVELAASVVHKIRDQCAYGWVQLQDLVVTV